VGSARAAHEGSLLRPALEVVLLLREAEERLAEVVKIDLGSPVRIDLDHATREHARVFSRNTVIALGPARSAT